MGILQWAIRFQSKNLGMGILQRAIRLQQNSPWASWLLRPNPCQANHAAILGLSSQRRFLYQSRPQFVPLLQTRQDEYQEPSYFGHS